MAARARAEREANAVIAHLPVIAATVASADSCVLGERDLWYTSQYQFSCHLDTIYYVPVDGALLPELAGIDEAARAAPLGLVPSEPFQNVQYYFAHGGKDTDGRSPSNDPVLRARENLIHVLMNHHEFVTIR